MMNCNLREITVNSYRVDYHIFVFLSCDQQDGEMDEGELCRLNLERLSVLAG